MDSVRFALLIICCSVACALYFAQVQCSKVFMQQPFKSSIPAENWIMRRRHKHIWLEGKCKQNNSDPCLNNRGFQRKAFKQRNTATIVMRLHFAMRTISFKTCIGSSCLFPYLTLWDWCLHVCVGNRFGEECIAGVIRSWFIFWLLS